MLITFCVFWSCCRTLAVAVSFVFPHLKLSTEYLAWPSPTKYRILYHVEQSMEYFSQPPQTMQKLWTTAKQKPWPKRLALFVRLIHFKSAGLVIFNVKDKWLHLCLGLNQDWWHAFDIHVHLVLFLFILSHQTMSTWPFILFLPQFQVQFSLSLSQWKPLVMTEPCVKGFGAISIYYIYSWNLVCVWIECLFKFLKKSLFFSFLYWDLFKFCSVALVQNESWESVFVEVEWNLFHIQRWFSL